MRSTIFKCSSGLYTHFYCDILLTLQFTIFFYGGVIHFFRQNSICVCVLFQAENKILLSFYLPCQRQNLPLWNLRGLFPSLSLCVAAFPCNQRPANWGLALFSRPRTTLQHLRNSLYFQLNCVLSSDIILKFLISDSFECNFTKNQCFFKCLKKDELTKLKIMSQYLPPIIL